jgi:hypothetical protein
MREPTPEPALLRAIKTINISASKVGGRPSNADIEPLQPVTPRGTKRLFLTAPQGENKSVAMLIW